MLSESKLKWSCCCKIICYYEVKLGTDSGGQYSDRVCVCVCVHCTGYLDNVHRTGNTLVVLHCVDLSQHGQLTPLLFSCTNLSARTWFLLSSLSTTTISWKYYFIVLLIAPLVRWRCWLGGRKGIRSVKNWVVMCWRGYLSGARCRLAYGTTDATATHCLLLQ